MRNWWKNSPIHYEGARLLGRRGARKVGFWPNARRLYWIFVRGYEYEICDRCGRPVMPHMSSWWHADNELWLRINGRSAGVLCPPCFIALCDARGLMVSWKAILHQ